MIDPYLVVAVVVAAAVVVIEEEVDFLVLRRFPNTNLSETIFNDVVHLYSMNLVYLIYPNPVLNDLVIR
jgi:hypothetical protein